MPDVSIVVPVLDEEGSLEELHHQITQVMEEMGRTFEVIYVDDGSRDRSLEILKRIFAADARAKVISLRKTHGKSAALAVGFDEAKGDIIVTIDADLQDDPHEIPNLIRELEKGYDVVSGWKRQRKDPFSKRFPSKVFNWLTSAATGLKLHDINCGLKAYRRSVTNRFKLYGQLHRFLPVFAYKEGFRVTELPVTHHPRRYGRTKYGVKRFLHGLLDLLTVILLTRYLKSPLHFFGTIGIIFTLAGFGINCVILSIYIKHHNIQGRHPLLTLGVLLMILGFQLISTGLLAELLTRMSHKGREEYSLRLELSHDANEERQASQA